MVGRWLRNIRRQFVELAEPRSDATHDDATVDCAEFDIGPAAAALRCASASERKVAIEIGSWLSGLVEPGAN